MAGLSYKFLVTQWNPEGAVFTPLTVAFEKSLDAIVIDARENLDSRLPGTSRNPTGRLRKSIRTTRQSRFAALFRAGDRSIKYAASQEYGSKPHEINARRKPNLVFPWEGSVDTVSGGSFDSSRLFIGPRVNHPGTSALNYMTDAAENFPRFFQQIGRMLFR